MIATCPDPKQLAGFRLQPTLILCQYGLAAATMSLLAHATGIQHFNLMMGLITAKELEAARLAEAVVGLPLQIARASVGNGWHGAGGSLLRTVVLDGPLAYQLERELARNPAMVGLILYSPIRH